MSLFSNVDLNVVDKRIMCSLDVYVCVCKPVTFDGELSYNLLVNPIFYQLLFLEILPKYGSVFFKYL